MSNNDQRTKQLRKAKQQAKDLRNTIWDLQAMDAASVFLDHREGPCESYTSALTDVYHRLDNLICEIDEEISKS